MAPSRSGGRMTPLAPDPIVASPANTLGPHRVMSAVDEIHDTIDACAPTAPNSSARWHSTRAPSCSATSAAPRASSLPWPSRSADAGDQLLAQCTAELVLGRRAAAANAP
jgi:hypothetical protein